MVFYCIKVDACVDRKCLGLECSVGKQSRGHLEEQ